MFGTLHLDRQSSKVKENDSDEFLVQNYDDDDDDYNSLMETESTFMEGNERFIGEFGNPNLFETLSPDSKSSQVKENENALQNSIYDDEDDYDSLRRENGHLSGEFDFKDDPTTSEESDTNDSCTIDETEDGNSGVLTYIAGPIDFVKKYFVEPIPNVTVPVGRDVVMQCTVRHLENHKVAWIKVDTQTLLTIHTRVITRDDRIKVTHNNFKQWFLHIAKVVHEDRGYYMCQMNTEPMVSQMGYLDVRVPPSIVEDRTSSDVVVDEMARVALKCEARGYPTPVIQWRREDGREINSGRKKFVRTVEGEFMNISQATREDMGAYLCIASNGIPPSVSKRILLQINFRPKIRVPNQLVGAPVGANVTLECILEASPRPLTSWVRSDGVLLLNNKKFQLEEQEESYKIMMRLRINDLSAKDFGSYKCIGKNLLGEKEGYIRLYEIAPPTIIPKPTTVYDTHIVKIGELGSWRNNSSKYDIGFPGTNSLVEETKGFILDKGRRQTNVQVQGEGGKSVQRPQQSESTSDILGCSSSSGLLVFTILCSLLSGCWRCSG